MTKNEAHGMLNNNVKSENLKRHCYAVSFALVGIYDYLDNNSALESDTTKETWEVLGLIHDADYELTKDDWTKHTLLLLDWLKDAGEPEDSSLSLAIKSHNSKITNLRHPQTQMEWALECCDELTGFIVACALVMPEKKLSAVDVQTVKKKFKLPSFAKAVDRSQIAQCEDKLNIPIDTFIQICLSAMQKNSEMLGL